MPPAPHPENEAERVRKLLEYDVLDTSPEQGYDDVTMLAALICRVPISIVTLVDGERQWFKSSLGLEISETPRSDAFCAHALLATTTLVVEDAQQDVRFADNPLVTGEPHIRFYAGAPLIAPTGHILGTVCVIDTEPRHLQPEQIRALEALSRQVSARLELRRQNQENERTAAALRTAEKLAAVGRMASALAHEINNPLQAVTNLLYIAQRCLGTPECAPVLAEAQDALRRVGHIVSQGLRFHRQTVRPETVQVGEIVRSVLDLFATRLAHAQVRAELRDRQKAPISVYAWDMRQVIANLLANALEAARSDGGTIRIRIHDARDVSTGRDGLRLTVADDGRGMNAGTMARLFEPFFTTKGERGTGLGLWLCKGIVTAHGGSMHGRSSDRAGRCGSVFSVVLPRIPSPRSEAGRGDEELKVIPLTADLFAGV